MSCSYRLTAAAALVAVFGASAMSAPASAQTSATASISANANVSGIAALTAAGVNNLNFGSVTAGTPKSPSSLASDAGRFNISGEPSTAVTVSFDLPTELNGAGSATIPITFATGDGILWTTFSSAFTTFNPNAPFFTSLNGAGSLTIGIAGTVSPPLGTTTGTYTGTITLTVAY